VIAAGQPDRAVQTRLGVALKLTGSLIGTKRARFDTARSTATCRSMNSSLSKKISASMASSHCNAGNDATLMLREAQ
jgi:hypothetical protein